MKGRLSQITVTIEAGATGLSGEVDLQGCVPVGLIMPATWTLANVTLQAAAASGGTFQNVYDGSGNERTITASQARHITLDPTWLRGVSILKLRSGTSATPVDQTTTRTLILLCRQGD